MGGLLWKAVFFCVLNMCLCLLAQVSSQEVEGG